MGQRDLARTAITAGIAPPWSVLRADLERMTPAADASTASAQIGADAAYQRVLV